MPVFADLLSLQSQMHSSLMSYTNNKFCNTEENAKHQQFLPTEVHRQAQPRHKAN